MHAVVIYNSGVVHRNWTAEMPLFEQDERFRTDDSRARLAAIVQSSGDAIVGETLDGIITDWNPAAERLYGYGADEVIGRHLTFVIPPERIAEANAILARAHNGETIEGFETVRIRKDGRVIDIALTVSPVRNETGQIIATSAFVRDITAIKASERALTESEARFRTAFEHAPTGMSLISPDWQLLQINRAACDIVGYSETELRGMRMRDITHPDDVDRTRDYAMRALAGEFGAYELEKRYVRPDGRIVWALLSVALVRDAAGTPRYFISQMQDISPRKETEAELAAIHQRTRDVLERITDAFYALDRDWRFTYLNEAAERILGYTRQELLGQNFWEAFPPAVETKLYDDYHRALAGGAPAALELFYPPTARWFEGQIYPSPNGLSVFFHDITERRQLEADVRASEAKYRSLIEYLPGAVYLLADDENQTPQFFSPYIEAVTGETPEEAMAFHDHWLDLVHPEDRERVAAEDKRSGERADQFRAEYRHRRKDGRYVWVRDECVPVYDEAGGIVGWQGIMLDITERVDAQQALAASETRFRTAFANAPIGMTLVDPEGRILQVNAAFCQMVGYEESELLDQTFQQLTYTDDLDANLQLTRSALAGERDTYELVKRYVRRDGQLVWTQVSASLVRSEDGAPQYIITHIQDITARLAAEAALARERDLLRTLMEHLPDAVYIKDTASRFLHLNPAAAQSLGLTGPEEALGKTDFDFYPEIVAREYLADEQHVMTSGEPLLNRLEPRSSDAAAAGWWVTSTVPVRDASGAVVGLVGSGRDITERLQVEEALRESEARQRALLAVMPDMVFRLNRDGTIMDYKADHSDDLYVPPEVFLGRTVAETLPAAVATAITAAMERVLALGQVEAVEYALELGGGQRHFEARLVAAGLDEVVAIVRNVTERKQAESKLLAALDNAQAAQRARSQFLAMMSHELRTPMQAVLGYSEMLQAQLAPHLTPEQAADFRAIREGAGRLVTLVNDILDFSRLEAGRLDLKAEPVDLVPIIEQVRQDVAPQAAAKRLNLSINAPAHLPLVLGDAVALQRIVLNLVSNAIKFTDKGSITVSASASETTVDVTVTDTGIGIDPAVIPFIFHEFRQADSGMTRRHEGAGLGLAIAKKLAEQMGGTISLTSQPEFGSTFTLHLPAQDQPFPKRSAAAS
jgi:PAS domain S-box-containing protein